MSKGGIMNIRSLPIDECENGLRIAEHVHNEFRQSLFEGNGVEFIHKETQEHRTYIYQDIQS